MCKQHSFSRPYLEFVIYIMRNGSKGMGLDPFDFQENIALFLTDGEI